MWLLAACTCTGAVVPTDLPDDSDSSVIVDTTDSSQHTGHSGETDPPDTDPQFAGPPRVILMIGDGMGFQHVQGAGLYANDAMGSLRMETLPVQGRLRTASLTGLTDSAAAATTMATGHKTVNGRLGQDKDQNDLQNLVELAREQGLATGVMSTDSLWGATPASFLVHVPSRNDGGLISEQIAAGLPDILLGGGASLLGPALDTVDALRLGTREELLALEGDGRPVVGLFSDHTFNFVVDGYDESHPTLAEMTAAALKFLQDDEDGFFLVVESARIDHASHAHMSDKVLQEVAAFDEAVGTALDWATDREEVTLVVTADHECGGLSLTGEQQDELPGLDWRSGDHTNEDVPIYASGPRTVKLDEQRLDNSWVHAVLSAAITDSPVQDPEPGPVVDGSLHDLGDRIVTQEHYSDFGHGHNQLDGLRLTSDVDGIRIGVDGIFEDRNNVPLVLLDLDFGQGTGLGSTNDLGDSTGDLDIVLSTMGLDIQVSGLGFDVAVGGFEARPLRITEIQPAWGARGIGSPWMDPGNLFWLHAIMNWDDGNVARDHEMGRDMGDPGETEHGWELLVPWQDLYGGPKALELAVVAVLVDRYGLIKSNQTLPPTAFSGVEGTNPIEIDRVVRMSVDGNGTGTATHIYPE